MIAGLRARSAPDLIQFGNLRGEHMEPAQVTYMPILKTKKGEWEALRHLAESDRDLMFPLIECTTLVFAPQQPATDHLKKHIDAPGASLEIAGAKQRIFGIDSSALLPTFPKQAKLLVSVCGKLTQKGLKIAPCILPAIVADSPAEIAALAEYEHVILCERSSARRHREFECPEVFPQWISLASPNCDHQSPSRQGCHSRPNCASR